MSWWYPSTWWEEGKEIIEDGADAIVKGTVKIGGVALNLGTLPFRKIGDIVAYTSDKIGDGLEAAFDSAGLDFAGSSLNFLADKIGSKIQGTIERGVRYYERLPGRIERTANDFFSDNLWNNFGEWLGDNFTNAVELSGIPEIAESIAENLKINTRGLSNHEKRVAKSVFGNSINLDLVRIDEWSLGNLVNGKHPFTTFNTINSWGKLDDDTLIHELTHVWQYSQKGAKYIPNALKAQQGDGIGGGSYPSSIITPTNKGYQYGGYEELTRRMLDGKRLSSFNEEQQAEIVEHYYEIVSDKDSINDKFLPLYAYFVQEASTLSLDKLTTPSFGLLVGNKNPNHLQGNARNEVLVGYAGDDKLFGNGGNDTLYGGLGDDHLYGGNGKDTLYGGDGDDTLYGEVGDDYLDGGRDSDTMYGGTGNDRYVVDSLGDRVIEYAGEGKDWVEAFISFTLPNHVENLQLTGTARAGTGNSLANTIIGNINDNFLWGYGGNDHLQGGGGSDNLYGGDGDDILEGGADRDILFGGNDQDTLYGGDGDDYLYGENGNDRLLGGSGKDTLVGGLGNDTLIGGTQADTFYFLRPNEGLDFVQDFNRAEGDKIQVLARGFGGGLTSGQLSSNQFVLGSAATNSSHRFIFNTSTNILSFDPDGAGGMGAQELAKVSSGVTLRSSDIWVI